MFGTPRRPATLPTPEVSGLPARAFHITTTEGRLAAWSWGAGPTVLLVHGWEGHAAQMTPFVAPLVEEGFRVVAFDMLAHGRSEGRYSNVVKFAQAVRDVAADIEPPSGEPLHAVIAHSLGGAATVLALRDGLRADHVVLLAPVAEPRPFARRLAAFLELSPERTDGLIDGIRQVLGGDLTSADCRVIARNMNVPALVFHDPTDREVPFEHGEEIAYWWPHARFVRLEGLGHRRLLKDASVLDQTVQFVRTPATQLQHSRGA